MVLALAQQQEPGDCQDKPGIGSLSFSLYSHFEYRPCSSLYTVLGSAPSSYLCTLHLRAKIHNRSVPQRFPSLHSGFVQNLCIATPVSCSGCKPLFIPGGLSSKADPGLSLSRSNGVCCPCFPKGYAMEIPATNALCLPSQSPPQMFGLGELLPSVW